MRLKFFNCFRTLSKKFKKNFEHKKVYLKDEKNPILYYRCAIW